MCERERETNQDSFHVFKRKKLPLEFRSYFTDGEVWLCHHSCILTSRILALEIVTLDEMLIVHYHSNIDNDSLT